MSVRIPEGLYYWHGEKPPPLPFEYVNEQGDLITSISGATLTAKTSIDGAAEADVDCTNDGDGTGTIDWPTGGDASAFALADGVNEGVMRIDIEVDEGTGTVWYLPRFTLPILRRT